MAHGDAPIALHIQFHIFGKGMVMVVLEKTGKGIVKTVFDGYLDKNVFSKGVGLYEAA